MATAISALLKCNNCCKKLPTDNFTESRIKRKLNQCKNCRRIYDRKRGQRLRKIDHNVRRLKLYMTQFAGPELANKLVSQETLLQLFQRKGIDVARCRRILVFPPRIGSDPQKLTSYQIIAY